MTKKREGGGLDFYCASLPFFYESLRRLEIGVSQKCINSFSSDYEKYPISIYFQFSSKKSIFV